MGSTFDQTPDKPKSFGYKVSWFALKASDPASVLHAMGVGPATPSNWASGLEAAHGSDPWIFVSPPISGWVFAISTSLPYPVAIEAPHDIGRRFDLLFSRLMRRFDDAQFFGSHRVADFVAWARALEGKLVRSFAWVGSHGEVLANSGSQTNEEAQLGLADLTGLSPSDATERIFALEEANDAEANRLVKSGLSRTEARARARQDGRIGFIDETDVIELAALWSIDPMRLSDQHHSPGSGFAARLPEALAQ